MIDYLTLLLVNMAIGFLLLGAYLFWGIDDADQRRWSPAFLITGLVGFLFGLHLTMTWPLIGAYNLAFGEVTVFFGALFLGAGLALALNWDLRIIALYAVFPGIVAILLGIRIIDLSLTRTPVMAGIGYMLSGLAGLLAALVISLAKKSRLLRGISLIVLVATALLWLFAGLGAYWEHAEAFKSWVPFSLRK